MLRLEGRQEHRISGDGLVFLFPVGGSGAWSGRGAAHPFSSGDVLVLNRNSGGHLHSTSESGLSLGYLSVAGDQLWTLCAARELTLFTKVMEKLRRPRLHPGADSMALRCHGLIREVPPEANLEQSVQLLRVVAPLLVFEFNEVTKGHNGFHQSEEHFLQALEGLSVAELIDLPIDELAAKFSCSRRHLDRLFQRFSGTSPRALRMEMRLLHAASLLRDFDAKVIKVAEQCGFNHLGLFNTCFKRRFGLSHSEWRKNLPTSNRTLTTLLKGHPDCEMRARGLCAWEEDNNGKKTMRRRAGGTPKSTPGQTTHLAWTALK